MLWLLLLVPLLAAVFAFAARRRRKRLERFGQAETLAGLMPGASPKRIRYKFICFEIALALVVCALAQPQFGSKLRESSREGMEIMLAVDVSNSMLAEDFEPNRLERTKYAIGRLLENVTEDRVGLIVFAGDAYVQLPVTSDYVAARNFARQLSPGMVSRQGTAIGAAINLAASSFSSDSEGSRAIILISDGENHEDDAIGAAAAAAEKGITIYAIGIGTPEGAPISLGGEFIKDEEGNMVVSRLDEKTLEQVALSTGGAYIRATARTIGLDEIIKQINETEKKGFTAQVFDEYNEQFQYLLAAALFFLLLGFAILPNKNKLLARFSIFHDNDK